MRETSPNAIAFESHPSHYHVENPPGFVQGGIGQIFFFLKSRGIFVGALGEKSKHIILAQNNFRYSDGMYDIDYAAVPLAWTSEIQVIVKSHLAPDEARLLLNSFLVGGRRTKRMAQTRVLNHGWT